MYEQLNGRTFEGGFVLLYIFIDFPFSLLVVGLSALAPGNGDFAHVWVPGILFAIFGSIWWYMVGMTIEANGLWFTRKLRI